MDLEDSLSSGKVRKLDGNAAVKAAGARQRGIERFGTVCCSKDDNAVVAFKAVHFGEKLIESLFPLVVSADLSVTLLSYRVDLVYEHDARCFLLRLAEKITHL